MANLRFIIEPTFCIPAKLPLENFRENWKAMDEGNKQDTFLQATALAQSKLAEQKAITGAAIGETFGGHAQGREDSFPL